MARLELAVGDATNVMDAVVPAIAECGADCVDGHCLAERLGATPAQVQEWFEAARRRKSGERPAPDRR